MWCNLLRLVVLFANVLLCLLLIRTLSLPVQFPDLFVMTVIGLQVFSLIIGIRDLYRFIRSKADERQIKLLGASCFLLVLPIPILVLGTYNMRLAMDRLNLMNLGLCILMYLGENKTYPPTMAVLANKMDLPPGFFESPGDATVNNPTDDGGDYRYCLPIPNEERYDDAETTVLIYGRRSYHLLGHRTFLFADGHVESPYSPDAMATIKANGWKFACSDTP